MNKKILKNTLYKLFYSDPTSFESEYKKRFDDENTIHLDINIGEHPAFICQSVETYKLIISIERCNNLVINICNKLPHIALRQFQSRCLIDEIVLTNNIEGVRSTRKEISEIIHDLSKNNKRERFVGLVNKYIQLITKEQINLNNSEDIRKIYDDIFYDEIKAHNPKNLPDGKLFRKSHVSVCSEADIEIHHGLFPENKIINTLDSALKFLNDTSVDYLIRIAVFHYLFGYIHPFYDGNGRTSRFISSYLLSRNLNHLIGYCISSTIKENIKKYYDAFELCNHHNNKGELTPFVNIFLEILNLSMKQLCDSLTEKLERLDYYFERISKLPNATKESMCELYFILIQAALFSNNGISQKELENELELSYNTVRSRLKRIPEELLIINRQGNRSSYLLNLQAVDKMFM